MSHTNSTTNYSLPQFLTSDKPAWLTDINNAFSDIDTGMHNAQTKANTADTNASQALLDASAAASAASTADSKGAGAVASLADAFQTTETYAVGDLVIYNNLLYICSVAVTDPGSWTGSTNWSRVTIEGYVNSKTAEDIPLDTSVGAPTTAQAIAAVSTVSDISAGVQKTSIVNDFEKSVIQNNKIVSFYVGFSLNTAPANVGGIATGFPVPKTLKQIPMICVSGTNKGKAARCAIDLNGNLINYYSDVSFWNVGDVYIANACYLMA